MAELHKCINQSYFRLAVRCPHAMLGQIVLAAMLKSHDFCDMSINHPSQMTHACQAAGQLEMYP
jgi:hypothetical protein